MNWLRSIMQIRVVPRRYERTFDTIVAVATVVIVAVEWLEFLRLHAEQRTVGALIPVLVWTGIGLIFVVGFVSVRRRRRSKLDRVNWTKSNT